VRDRALVEQVGGDQQILTRRPRSRRTAAAAEAPPPRRFRQELLVTIAPLETDRLLLRAFTRATRPGNTVRRAAGSPYRARWWCSQETSLPDSAAIEEAVRLHELAVRERMAGRPADALPRCIEALALLEQECDAPSPDVANVLNTLGSIRQDLSEYGDAEGAYRRAATILAEIDSDDPVLVRLRVRTTANLAAIHRVQGRLDEAERGLLEAIIAAEAAFDPNGPELPSLLNDLAMVYKYAGRFDEAEALYRRALAALDPEHADAASIWHNLGGIEHARGRFAEGEPFARRAVEIREALLGADHPAVAADVAALAALVQEQGRLDEAEALYRRALAVFEAALGPEHYELAINYNNLGALQAARGETAEAEALYLRSLQIKEALLGPEHPDVALTAHNLAVLRAGQGRSEEAEALYRRALSIFETNLGPEHPKTRTCRRELDSLLER
jgi:tetratricopeptide (TPR) repeat protein